MTCRKAATRTRGALPRCAPNGVVDTGALDCNTRDGLPDEVPERRGDGCPPRIGAAEMIAGRDNRHRDAGATVTSYFQTQEQLAIARFSIFRRRRPLCARRRLGADDPRNRDRPLNAACEADRVPWRPVSRRALLAVGALALAAPGWAYQAGSRIRRQDQGPGAARSGGSARRTVSLRYGGEARRRRSRDH
jgi:hypothetical protein